jgi:thiol-disulfide isomerase/thioredoxin
MRIYLVAFFVSVVVGIFGYWGAVSLWGKRSQTSDSLDRLSQMKIWESEGAPDFEVSDWGSLSQISTPIRIVHFWASWCGPCVEELPSLTKLAATLQGKVTVLALSQDSSEEEMVRFLKEHGMSSTSNLKFIFDQKHRISSLYKSEKLPESYIVMTEKNLLKKKVSGSVEWVIPESLSYFESLISSASQ